MRMRVLFLLLLLANFAFFAWDHYLRTPLSPETRIQQVQMTPEKIRIVNSPAAPPPAPASPPTASPAAKAGEEKPAKPCLAWGVFVGPQDAARADAAMAETKLTAAQVRRVVSDVDGHWVLIPPLKSQADITKVVDNLKKLGVADYSIVTEPPQWRNAISLGIFRTEDAARTLLADLQNKGVTDLTLERRERFFQQMVYLVREPDNAAVERLTVLRQRVPGSEVKAVACPAG